MLACLNISVLDYIARQHTSFFPRCAVFGPIMHCYGNQFDWWFPVARVLGNSIARLVSFMQRRPCLAEGAKQTPLSYSTLLMYMYLTASRDL